MALPIPAPRPAPVPPRRLPHIPQQPPAPPTSRRTGPPMPPRITPPPVRSLDRDGPPEGHEWCPSCGGSGCSHTTSDRTCDGCAGARIVTTEDDDR